MQPPNDPIRKIIHIDKDAYYASVEQRDNPALRGKPVAVGSARQRGVVAAASYEARRYGVRSAMASVTALRKCPDLVFVPHRFEVYRGISQEIRQIFFDYTHLVEPLSLDEAYLDVTDNRRGLPTAAATAQEIRTRILAQTGLTASAGISYNKLLAKLASDHRKPDGQYVIPPNKGADFVAALPVGKFHGIGPATAAKLNGLGIHTGSDLRLQPLTFLLRHFGKQGHWYHSIARGEDARPVRPDRQRKSSGSETTYPHDLTTAAEIEAGIIAQADEVWDWCHKSSSYGRTLTVKIKYADFEQITRSRSLPGPLKEQALLRQISTELVHTMLPSRRGIRLLGVTVSNFATEQRCSEQLPLELGVCLPTARIAAPCM